jgi:hypothetical protein
VEAKPTLHERTTHGGTEAPSGRGRKKGFWRQHNQGRKKRTAYIQLASSVRDITDQGNKKGSGDFYPKSRRNEQAAETVSFEEEEEKGKKNSEVHSLLSQRHEIKARN